MARCSERSQTVTDQMLAGRLRELVQNGLRVKAERESALRAAYAVTASGEEEATAASSAPAAGPAPPALRVAAATCG